MQLEQWLYRIPLLFRLLFQRRRVEQDLDDEVGYHLQQQFELNKAAGMAEREALLEARRAFGHIEARKEFCRDHWAVAAIDRLRRDVRQALRTLGKDSFFTVGVLVLLAAGIGANVAAFSVVNSVLLKPLSYSEPDRLMIVHEAIPQRDSNFRSVNALHFNEWSQCSCFEDLALAEYSSESTLTGEGEPVRLRNLRVTPNAFSVLGVSAQLGRTLMPADGEPGGETNVVISDGLWRGKFGSNPDIVGQTVTIDAISFTVVGVLPAGFSYRPYGTRTIPIDIYAPWNLEPQPWWQWTNNYSYNAVGRLAAGVSPEAALAELNTIQAGIAAEHFTGDSAALSLEAVLTPLHDWVTGQSRSGLFLLLAAVVASFLVACLNIANLMLIRATARSREAGIRSALGATRLAIFRSIFMESALLAIGGAIVGIAIAWAAVEGISNIATTGLPRIDEAQLDLTVLLGAIAVTVVAMLVFGLLPALKLTRVDPERALEGGGRAAADSTRQMRGRYLLVSAEVALSVTLMIVAGLLLVSFVRLNDVDRGFDSTNVMTADVGLPVIRYQDNESRLQFWNALRVELTSAPGVVEAGFTSVLPLLGNFFGSTAIREGEQPAAEDQPAVQYRFISEGYLDAIGVPILRGRSLNADDYGRDSAIVSERTASLLWGDANPIGRRFHWNEPDNLFEVVGVVPDVPSVDLESEPSPIVYRPLTATGDGHQVTSYATIAVRTAGNPDAAASILRLGVASLDPDLAISRLQSMQQIERSSVGGRRFQLYLVGAFGAASLLIAALGVYSVLAYTVSARHHELAMRMALGASRSKVFSLVLKQGMRPVLVGIGIGLAGAVALGRMFSSLLFGVAPTDATTILVVVAVTFAAAFFASILPASRATSTSVLAVLRCD